jgi:hypothetical protein
MPNSGAKRLSKQKANLIGHILRRNCLLQQVIEGKIKGGIEVRGRRGRRRRKLLDDLKGKESILPYGEGSSISHCEERSLWKRLWTCHERLLNELKYFKNVWMWFG